MNPLQPRIQSYPYSCKRTYILVDKEKPTPTHLPEGTVVKVPLERSMVYSSVHCNLFKQLESLDAVAGVCGLQYIKVPEIQEGCRNGSVTDCGNSMNPDIEKIIDIHPDAILLSPFENSGGYGRIEKLNVPIIECADYMETSPLGRAEWMYFYGLLTGRKAQADSLFRKVEQSYLDIKRKAGRCVRYNRLQEQDFRFLPDEAFRHIQTNVVLLTNGILRMQYG